MVKIYASDDINPGEDFESPTPTDSRESPNGARPDGAATPDFNIIIGAPDLAQLIARPLTKTAREYRDKTAGLFKMGVVGSLQTGNYADAATLLWHGPGAASAVGDLCANYSVCANAIDIITTPSSPIAQAIITALPLISQLARNHEKQLAEMPKRFDMSRRARAQRKAAKMDSPQPEPSFTLKIGRRRIPVRWTYKPRFLQTFARGVMSQTHEPSGLTQRVFTDPKVIKELGKMGVHITTSGGQ